MDQNAEPRMKKMKVADTVAVACTKVKEVEVATEEQSAHDEGDFV